MLIFVTTLLATLASIFRSRASRGLENLALRYQIGVLHRSAGKRPKLTAGDRLLWICLSRLWRDWRSALAIVKPETVVAWHRAAFRLFWTWKVRCGKPGRPVISSEVRDLIRKMCRENPGWGAPRIHGELLKLGIDVGQSSVSNCARQFPLPNSCATSCATTMRSLAMTSENTCETWAFAKSFLHRARLGSEPISSG